MRSIKRKSKNYSADMEKPHKGRETGLEDLVHEELSGPEDEKSSLATSNTDDDEDEGLGDGNIGRSKNNILSKE